jgi:hypothetical protein
MTQTRRHALGKFPGSGGRAAAHRSFSAHLADRRILWQA